MQNFPRLPEIGSQVCKQGMVWNFIPADIKILKAPTYKRVSSYLKTYLQTPSSYLQPGGQIKIINFCIGPNKIQKIFALRRAPYRNPSQEASSLRRIADRESKRVICVIIIITASELCYIAKKHNHVKLINT